MIVRYTGYDLEQIDRIYRSSNICCPEIHEYEIEQGLTHGESVIRKILDAKPIKNDQEVEGYLAYKHTFRFNQVLGRTEIMQDGT